MHGDERRQRAADIARIGDVGEALAPGRQHMPLRQLERAGGQRTSRRVNPQN
jgi:hypothetical protein